MTLRAPLTYTYPARPFIQGHIQGRAGVPSGDKQFGAAGQWKAYDWPNPTLRKDAAYLLACVRSEGDVWSNRLTNLYKGLDKQFRGPGQWATYDYPNPAGWDTRSRAQPSFELRTWVQSLDPAILGKDRQFRGPGQWTAYDWPNPNLGKIRDVTLLTWVQGPIPGPSFVASPFTQDDWPNPQQLIRSIDSLSWIENGNSLTTVAQSPFSLDNWPNPGSPLQNYDLKTFLNSMEPSLIGQDTFFGATGQGPANQDWPVPKGPRGSVDLGTWAQNLSQTTLTPAAAPLPFNLYDWENPTGYFFSYELRTIASSFSMLDAIPPHPPEPIPDVPSTGGGASGTKRYRQPAWWGDEKKKKLEKKIEAVQKQIEKKREQIDFAPDLFRMQRLIEQIAELQKRLMKLLEQIDELNKLAGEEEVMLIYTIYRSLH